jgi:hypothetical protein
MRTFRVIGRRAKQRFTRRSFAVGAALIVTVMAICSLLVVAADAVIAWKGKEQESQPDFALRHAISFGASKPQDFKGTYYSVLPSFDLCPRSDGSWIGQFSWLLTWKGKPTKASLGMVGLSVPAGTTNIRSIIGSAEIPALGERFEAGAAKPTPPHIQDLGNHKLIQYGPQKLLLSMTVNGKPISTHPSIYGVGFTLPPSTTKWLGLGRRQSLIYYRGHTGDLSGELHQSSASYRPSRGETRVTDGNKKLHITICKSSFKPISADTPSPETNFSSETYSWTVPIEGELLIQGETAGGWLYNIRQFAPALGLSAFWSLIGAVYGLAIQSKESSGDPSQGQPHPEEAVTGERAIPPRQNRRNRGNAKKARRSSRRRR